MAKEYPMKLASLPLLAALALAGFATAQTPPPAAAAAPPASSSESGGKIDKACKKEIKDLCGRAHGQEMTDCVKSGMDMNKFSASCAAEIKAHKSKS
jgi:hypothetical protein